MRRRVQVAQGTYYLTFGLWPVVHFRSFTAVSGPKPDRFQTQATGALFAATGFALLAGDPASRTARLLAGGTALAALAMELAYRRWLPRVFLVDAACEATFLCAALEPVTGAVTGSGRVSRSAAGRRPTGC